MSFKLLLILNLTFFSILSFSNPNAVVEEVYRVRAQTYSSYQVSNSLLNNLNSPDYLDLRGDFLSETGRGTGNNIPDTWLHNAREYMSTVNNRAAMDPNNINPDQEPEKSPQAQFEEDMKLREEAKLKKVKETTLSFNKNNQALMENLTNVSNYKANKELFEKNGLGHLFGDIFDHLDTKLGSPSAARKFMEQIVGNKDLIKKMNHPELNKLLISAESTSRQRRQIIEAADRDIKKRTEFFETAKKKPSAIEAKQIELDKKYFKSKNLQPIKNLNEMTNMERIKLLNHPDAPMKTGNFEKAIDIINDSRKKQRDFVKKVKDISTDISQNAESGKAYKADGNKLTAEKEKLRKVAQNQGHAKKYKDMVSSRLAVARHKNGLDSLPVTNQHSRLALVDIISDGSINPHNSNPKFDTKKGLKDLDLREAFNRIPAKDAQARKALAEYVLDHGDANQKRSLRFIDHTAYSQAAHSKNFKLNCRKPGRAGW